jgi:mono/diheme cytochrome c family protein
MRHALVTRITLALALLLAGASLLFAWGVRRPSRAASPALPPAERGIGKALFARHCAGCHAAGELAEPFRRAADQAAAEMLRFLEDHAPAGGEAERRAIVEHVRGAAAGR